MFAENFGNVRELLCLFLAVSLHTPERLLTKLGSSLYIKIDWQNGKKTDAWLLNSLSRATTKEFSVAPRPRF